MSRVRGDRVVLGTRDGKNPCDIMDPSDETVDDVKGNVFRVKISIRCATVLILENWRAVDGDGETHWEGGDECKLLMDGNRLYKDQIISENKHMNAIRQHGSKHYSNAAFRTRVPPNI